MSESREAGKAAHAARIEKLRQTVLVEGKVDPNEDPEFLEKIRQANLSQTEVSGEDETFTPEPLPRSPDQDPDSPAHFLPRIDRGRKINQGVGTQGTLDGMKESTVMSNTSRGRVQKRAQPYERGRIGETQPPNPQKASQQRFAIRQDMRKRGEDV